MLTDQQIAALSPTERRDLIARLARPPREVGNDPDEVRRRRRLRIGVTGAAAVLLLPWMAYLAHSLPTVHKVRDWDMLWLGFDAIEVALFALTFWLFYQRRLVALLAGFGTGVVLLCDAWFDVMTSGPGDFWQAVIAAVVLEIPLAVLLMSPAFRAIRVVPTLLWFAEPGAHSWQVRMPLWRHPEG